MMDAFTNIGMGFSLVLNPSSLGLCFVGVFVGTLMGMLPGIGPVGGVSLLLPLSFSLQPLPAIILLAGVFYGCMFGGAISSILLNIPGDAAAVVTTIEGYQLARKGRAGAALGMSACSSFIGGTIGVIGIMFFAPILGRMALSFGAPEYFSLAFLGLTLVIYLSRGSKLNAMIVTILGLIASTIGTDPVSGAQRFTYGSFTLFGGLNMVPVAMGLYGIAEILDNLGHKTDADQKIVSPPFRQLLPNIQDWKASIGAIARGSFIGFFMGILPGPGPVIAAFTSYTTTRKLSRHPEKFGTGVIEGVAAPECANNAATSGAFIPLLSLGVPGNVVIALIMGALMIHGIQPGPLFISQHPDIFWGVIASMYIGNVLLIILNIPLIGMWVKILQIPYYILFPIVILFCLIGSYSLASNIVEVFIMLLFGIIGFVMKKTGFEPAPFLLALVLGTIMEASFRQALLISRGDMGTFFTRPVSAILLAVGVLCLLTEAVSGLRKRRRALAAREAGK